MKKYLFIAALLFIGISSCQKNIEQDEVTIIKPDIKILIMASFKGHVVDETGSPIANATIEIGNNIGSSNGNGLFEFRDIEVSKERVLIKASKNGFFIGASTVTVGSQGLNYASVSMAAKGTPQHFSAQNTATIETQGVSIKIPKNSLVDANQTPYYGVVKAYTRYLSPDGDNFVKLMPGELIGIDEQGKKSALSALAILQTEFTTDSGAKLQLAKNKNLEITLPLTPEAAAKIPLVGAPIWRYNYTLGLWAKDDGTCNSTGQCAGGSGFIGVCIPFDPIKISGYVYHHDGSPAGSVIASLKGDDNFYRFRWLTDSLGFFQTLAPKDMTFNYTIEDHCLNTMNDINIGTFTEDVLLDNVVLDSSIQTYEFILSGTARQCDNTPIANAYVELRFPGNRAYFYAEADGSFNEIINFPCSSFPEIKVTAYDIFNKKRSADATITTEGNINVGDLTTCENPEDYFEFTYGDSTYFLFPTHGKYFQTLNPTYKEYNIKSKTLGATASLILEGFTDSTTTTTGRFAISNYPSAPLYFSALTNSIYVNITENTNKFFIGKFNGLIDTDSISGTFKSRK